MMQKSLLKQSAALIKSDDSVPCNTKFLRWFFTKLGNLCLPLKTKIWFETKRSTKSKKSNAKTEHWAPGLKLDWWRRDILRLRTLTIPIQLAPVVKYSSIRFIPTIIACVDLHLQQINAVTAFLYGKIQEGVFMKQLEGFLSADKQNNACQLLKALYSLK